VLGDYMAEPEDLGPTEPSKPAKPPTPPKPPEPPKDETPQAPQAKGGAAETALGVFSAARHRDLPGYRGPQTPDEVIEERAVFYGRSPEELRKYMEESGFVPEQVAAEAQAGVTFRDSVRNAEYRRKGEALPVDEQLDLSQIRTRALATKAPFFGMAAEDDPEVTKDGDPTFARVRNTLADMISKGTLDVREVPIYEELGAPAFVGDYMEKTLRAQGVDPNAASKEQRDAARKEALTALAAERTGGLWTGPAALPLHEITGEEERWWHNFLPLTEVAGFNAQGEVVYRQQGLTSFILDADGLASYGLLGAVDRLTSGESPFEDSFWKGVAEDVGSRRDFVREGQVQGRRLFGGGPSGAAGAAIGLAAEIGMPGLIPTSASGIRKVAKGISSAADARKAKKIGASLSELADAIEAGRYADAARMEGVLRERNPEIAGALDRVIGQKAVSHANSDVRNADLTDDLPQGEPGRLSHLASPKRKTEGMRTEGVDSPQFVAHEVARDYGQNLSDAQRIAQRLRDPDLARVRAVDRLAVADPTMAKRIDDFAFVVSNGNKKVEAAAKATALKALRDGTDLVAAMRPFIRIRAAGPQQTRVRHLLYQNAGRLGRDFKTLTVPAEAARLDTVASRVAQAATDSTKLAADSARELAEHFRKSRRLTDPTVAPKVVPVEASAADWYFKTFGGDLDEWKKLAQGKSQAYLGYTQLDLARQEKKLDALRQAQRLQREAPLRTGARVAGAPGRTQETRLSEALRARVADIGKVDVSEDAGVAARAVNQVAKALGWTARVSAALLLGSDVDSFLRTVPVATREPIRAGLRYLSLMSADIVLVARNNPDDLIKYLKGEQVRHYSGRMVATSGFNAAGASQRVVNVLLSELSADDLDLLMLMASRAEAGVTDLAALSEGFTPRERDHALALAKKFLKGDDNGNDFLSSLSQMIGVPDAPTPQDFKLLGALLDYGIAGDIDSFLRFIDTQYGTEAMTRSAVWMGWYGHRSRVLSDWTDAWVVVDESKYRAMVDYFNGNPESAGQAGVGRSALAAWGLGTTASKRTFDMIEAGRRPRYVPQGVRVALDEQLQAVMGASKRITGESDTKGATGALFVSLLKSMITRGTIFARPVYYLMNLVDSATLAYQAGGAAVGIAHLAQQAPQNLLAVPGVANVLSIKSGWLEEFRRVLGDMGDSASQNLLRAAEGGALDPTVNRIYDGDELLTIGDRTYRASDLRKIAIEEGVMTSFEVEGVGARVVDSAKKKNKSGSAPAKIAGKVRSMTLDATADLSEGWAERERLGLMVILMRFGKDAREAARGSNMALLEFRRGDSALERSLFFQLIQPFWTFTRAANTRVIDSFNDPQALKRMSRAMRLYHRGPEALQIIQQEMVAEDPYGVDLDFLPADVRQTYNSLIALKHLHKLAPEEEAEFDKALSILMRGEGSGVISGRRYEVGTDLQPKTAGASGIIAPFMLQEVNLAGLPAYMEEGAVQVQLPRTEQVRAMEGSIVEQRSGRGYATNNGMARVYAYVAEPAVVSGLNSIATWLALSVVVAEGGLKADDSAIKVAGNIIAEFASPEKSPIGQTILDITNPNEARPLVIHPGMAEILHGVGAGMAVETVAPELVDPLTGRKVQQASYALSGVPAAVFRLTPILAEMNNHMMAFDNPDLELQAATRVRVLEAASALLGARATSR